jgi:hypothetical protein
MKMYDGWSDDEMEDRLDDLYDEKDRLEKYPFRDAEMDSDWKEVLQEISTLERLLS